MIKFTLGIWILILVGGISAFAKFAYTPGAAANAPKVWPALTQFKMSSDLPEILVFLHPKCGCSQATLQDLESMLPEIAGRAHVKIVFNDLGDSKLLLESRAYAKAKTLKDVDIFVDRGGLETSIFGVKTSGQAMLFDESGALVFTGGLTPSRGHQGVSEGELSIVKWVNSRQMIWQTSSVFGCAMKETL